MWVNWVLELKWLVSGQKTRVMDPEPTSSSEFRVHHLEAALHRLTGKDGVLHFGEEERQMMSKKWGSGQILHFPGSA